MQLVYQPEVDGDRPLLPARFPTGVVATTSVTVTVMDMAVEAAAPGTGTIAVNTGLAVQSTLEPTLWLYDTQDITGMNLETVTYAQLLVTMQAALSTGDPIEATHTLIINGALREVSDTQFQGGVWVAAGGVVTTAWPAGTPGTPVGNLTVARQVANAKGFQRFFIRDGTHLVPEPTIGFEFIGVGAGGTNSIIDANGFTMDKSTFTGVTVRGAFVDGDFIVVNDGILETASNVSGILTQSGISGPISMPATPAPRSLTLYQCTDLPNISGAPVIDMGGAIGGNGVFHQLGLRGHMGEVTIQNQAAPATSNLTIEGISCGVTLAASVLGDIRTAGIFGDFTDNSPSVNKTYEHINRNEVSAAVWGLTEAALVSFGETGELLLFGNTLRSDIDFTGNDVLGWQLVIFDRNDTEIARANLFDEAFARIPSSVTVQDFIAARKTVARVDII